MKRYIHSATDRLRYPKQGFLFTYGKHTLFLESSQVNVTDKIARIFINKICDIRNVGPSIRESALYNKDTLNDFKRRIDKAIIEEKPLNDGSVFYTISGHGFSISYPESDFNEEVMLID